MEAQWPLIIFTFGICISSGTLAGMSFLSIKKKGETLLFPGLIVAAVALVCGGLGAFLHLEHWERIFNGFGHLTSGITQELIGCVVLAVLMVVWFFALRGKKGASPALAWVTIILTIIMVVVTAHSYMMPALPAWGVTLVVFYLANAFLLGAVVIWALASAKKDNEAEASAVTLTLWGAIAQLLANAIFVAVSAGAKIYDYAFYADPTMMTTAPTHIDNLATIALTGEAAPIFWISIVAAIIAVVCAVLAKKKIGAAMPFMAVALICALVTSLAFRVVIYALGFSMFLMY